MGSIEAPDIETPIEFEGGQFVVHPATETRDESGQPVRAVRIEFQNVRLETRSVEVRIWPEDRTEDRHVGFSSRGEFVDTSYSFPLSALQLALEQLLILSPSQAPVPRTSVDILDEEGPE